jgi:hypothetical protein
MKRLIIIVVAVAASAAATMAAEIRDYYYLDFFLRGAFDHGPWPPKDQALVDSTIRLWTDKTGITVTQSMRARILGGGTRAIEEKLTREFAVADNDLSDPEKRAELTKRISERRETLAMLEWSYDSLAPTLTRFPDIKIVVQPRPPLDYAVEINGSSYPATEKSLYGVAPGFTKVRITREGKNPCVWEGIVTDKEQVVNCVL